MKKIMITVLFFLCLLTAKAVFAQTALYDDFQSYPAGRFQDSDLWGIQEKSETGGNISVESSGSNQFIKNEIVYKTGYEKSDSFL